MATIIFEGKTAHIYKSSNYPDKLQIVCENNMLIWDCVNDRDITVIFNCGRIELKKNTFNIQQWTEKLTTFINRYSEV